MSDRTYGIAVGICSVILVLCAAVVQIIAALEERTTVTVTFPPGVCGEVISGHTTVTTPACRP